ncbi:hypothetical protein Franean1_3117 [Parafrankia sp. EAN1pec]|nr:hypothetical protein Franean1_3117 [Frankia sp. EAN1pec]
MAGTEAESVSAGGGSSGARRFTATLMVDSQGRTHVPIPFDPDQVWGRKPRHHVAGVIEGCQFRGVVDSGGEGRVVVLGPAWNPAALSSLERRAEVVIEAEGPQRADLAPDVAAALDGSPAAGTFFDSLAQFYRKKYLSWIDATKRRPDQRLVRIAEMVRLLEAGQKERPRP